MNQYIEKHAIEQETLSVEQIVSKAYKSGIASRRNIARVLKEIQSRRTVVAKSPAWKKQGMVEAGTVESAITDGRISFKGYGYLFGRKEGCVIVNDIPFTIANHAMVRYFERTTETDFLIEYRPALAFYCMYSLMYAAELWDSTEVIMPCESGLLLGSIDGETVLNFELFDVVLKKFIDTGYQPIPTPAAKIIAKTFISHNEMFENQTALWEKMMTFYDKHDSIFDAFISRFTQPNSNNEDEAVIAISALVTLAIMFKEEVGDDITANIKRKK